MKIEYRCAECGELVPSEGLTVDETMACAEHPAAVVNGCPVDYTVGDLVRLGDYRGAAQLLNLEPGRLIPHDASISDEQASRIAAQLNCTVRRTSVGWVLSDPSRGEGGAS